MQAVEQTAGNHDSDDDDRLPIPPQQRRAVSFANLTQTAIQDHRTETQLRAELARADEQVATLQMHLDSAHSRIRRARLRCPGCGPDDAVPAQMR